MVRETTEDRIFNSVSLFVLFWVAFLCVFPLLFVVSVSLTPITEVFKNGGFILVPKQLTLNAYEHLFTNSLMPNAFKITVFITFVGTLVSLTFTTLLAYPLSRKDLPGRSQILFFIVFTMLFNGGLIPTYLVVKNVGLLNSIWAMIIPYAVFAYYTMIMKGFFENMPNELFESARMDGASEWLILARIVLPLSLPVMASVGLFYAVSRWNTFMAAVLYITDPEKKPMQVIVRNMLAAAENNVEALIDEPIPSQTIKMAAVVFSAIPIIMVYPFLQRFFVKGVMIGAVKG
jgi:putative aldouronate transport system permease protein